jgi:predicted esterase
MLLPTEKLLKTLFPFCLLKRYIKTITIILFGTIVILSSCTHDEDEVIKIDVFDTIPSCEVTGILYAVAPDTANLNTNLYMDVYMPPVFYKDQQFPTVLLIHAGSYLHGLKSWIEPSARLLRDLGFVTVNIEYRQGWINGANSQGNCHTLSEAEYRGMQDARAALRFIAAHAEEYHIDRDKLFVMGESAGASIALNSILACNEVMLYKSPGLVYKLGGLDGSGNSLPADYNIKAICSKYGSLSDSNFLNQYNTIPIICFHGENDNLVPIYKGYFLGNHEVEAYGSRFIYEKQLELGSPCVFYMKAGGSHMPSDFAAEISSPVIADFFYSVLSDSVQSGIYIK